ncbi:MAG: GAF domain-containing protein, partial [Okeania sp. SIO2H7]|nr:GAF domain-containing protein [Okeania sp. SIO2H7]
MSQHPIAKDFGEEITTLERVLQVLREEENVDVLIDTILNYLESELNYQLIWVGLYDRLDHRLFGKGGITPDGDTSFLKQKFILNPGDLLEQVVIQLRPVNVPNLQEETRAGEWRKLAINCNIQSTILFPIRYKDRCFGVV